MLIKTLNSKFTVVNDILTSELLTTSSFEREDLRQDLREIGVIKDV